MSYPKPLSEKTIKRLYADAKITESEQEFLHKFALACSNLYGIISVRDMWEVYKVLVKKNYWPVLQRKDFIAFSSIARREELPYRFYEMDEIYTEEKRTVLDRELINTDILCGMYYNFARYYDLVELQADKGFYTPDNFLDYAEPVPNEYEKRLKKFLNSLRSTDRKINGEKGVLISNPHLNKTLKEFSFLTADDRFDLDYYGQSKRHQSIIDKILEDTKIPESAKLLRNITSAIQYGIPLTGLLECILDELQEVGVSLNERKLQEFVNLMYEYNNNSHLMCNRGWTPEELFMQQRQAAPFAKPAIVIGDNMRKMIESGELDGDELKEMLREKGFTVLNKS